MILPEPVCDGEVGAEGHGSRACVDNRFRILKNATGSWIIVQ